MTKIYLAGFRRLVFRKFRKLSLITITAITLVVGLASSALIVGAFSWASPIKMGVGGGFSVLFDPSMRARPTDGTAYVVGEPGNPDFLFLDTSTSPSINTNINDATSNGSKRNHLGFAQDGTGYFVWRQHPAGYQSWLRKINPDGSLTPGVDLGALYKNSSPSGKELDLPDVAVSKLTGKVYVAGSVVTGPAQHLGFAEYNPASQNLSGVIDYLPDNNGGEMKPRICVDNSQGRDDIHIVGWFGFNLYGIDRINGTWYPSAALTSSAAIQYQLGQALSIACDSNGYAYAAFDSISSTNATTSTGLARYIPNANPNQVGSWALVNRNPGYPYGAYDIYGPTYSNTWICDIPGVGGSAVAVTPDHEVWVTSGVRCGTYSGQIVASFSNNGATMDTFDRAVSAARTSKKVDIDFSPVNGRMHAVSQYDDHRDTFYTYTTLIVPPANFVATAVNYKRIDLSWTYPSPGTFTNVQLERSTDNVNWGVIAQLPVSTLSYSDNNLASPSTLYYYRIKGYNATTSSAYVTASAATLPVPTPSNFTAAPASFKQINLGWTYPSPADLTNIQLERSINNVNWTIIAPNLPITQTSYVDNNLASPGTLYYYRIKGYNANVASAYVTASASTIAPAYLAYDSGPAQIEPAPTTFGVPPVLSVRDPYGNVVTNYTGSVTLTITAGPAGYTFGGTKTVATVNGVADFSSAGLSLDKIGTYTLLASAPGFSSGTIYGTRAIAVRAKLAFSSGTIANQLVNGQFPTTIQVQRPSDNSKVTNYSGVITMTLMPSNRAAGAKLNGGTSITGNIVNGEVTFNNLVIDTYGPNYQLSIISADPISPALSNGFDVLANPVFTTVPTPVTANNSFTVVVTVQDAANTTLTNYNGQVTLSANSGTLLGIPSVNAVNGVATFNNLAFSSNGTYTLHAALPLGNSTNSSNITVNSPTSCQSLVVNTTSLTGDDAGSGCTTITLPGALGRATNGDVIRFASNVLGQTINLGSGAQSMPGGVSFQGGCDSNGPRVTIAVSGSRSNFQVGPNSSIWGIKLSNLKLSLPSIAKGNQFSCFVTAP